MFRLKSVWSVTLVSPPPAQTVKEEIKYMVSPPVLSNQERDVKTLTAALSLKIQNNQRWNELILRLRNSNTT